MIENRRDPHVTNQYHGSGRTVSAWMSAGKLMETHALTHDIETDICIVGAGIAGLSTAYLLAREGRDVVVIDDGEVGGGETSRTTAHLVTALDDRYFELERVHGEENARLAAQSNVAAIDRIEAIVNAEKIECEFERVDGYLLVPAEQNDGLELLQREFEAAQRVGLAGIERLERAPLTEYDTGPCLRFARQGQFHPLKYLAGLAGAIQRHGGQIYTWTRADKIKGGGAARVETHTGAVITPRHIVVATNTPVNDLVAIHTKQAPYRTYVIAAHVPAGAIPRVLFWDGYWGDNTPYHYVRVHSESSGGADNRLSEDLLIVGGEDHKTGQADDAADRFARLEEWMRRRFPGTGEIAYRWSGQVMEPHDGLPFIGRNPLDADNVYVATGDSGTGMTNGTIAAILLCDMLQGRGNKWIDLYDPSRMRLKSAPDFARENLNFVVQYKDWIERGNVRALSQIAPGSGAVMQQGMKKVAVYRDEAGGLHECSAMCPHLGCVVHFNSEEKTWDCPCHGSRFDVEGRMLHGPASSDLALVSQPVTEKVPDTI